MLPDYMVDTRIKHKYGYALGRSYQNLSVEEQQLLDNRDAAQILCEVHDGASYEYDDWALIQLNDTYYVVNTSGCSCPDPADTWYIVRAGTKQDIVLELMGSNGINRAFRNVVAKLDGWEAVTPCEPKKRYDW